MGLAGPRKRTKITHDPNNTSWTRKKGLGHNLLVSQGWKPGQTLGARNAPHAESYTAASHSHIRTLFRENGLGLGARTGGFQNGTESTGLDAFQGILGRLNGKSDEALAKEQNSRDDARRNTYAALRFGSLRFVSGGTLHGDKILALVSSQSQKSETEASQVETSKDEGESKISKKERKEAKRKRKAEKAQRKLERAQRRAAKVLSRESEPSKPDVQADVNIVQTESPATRVSQSASSSRTESPAGIHAVRQRYIKQKRLAYADPKALNEILMIKS